MSDLSAWHAALDAVGTAQARVLWLGDSIFEGTGSTTRRKRALDLILDDFVRNHPVAGYGRCQYLPAHFAIPNSITPWAPTWYTSKSGTVTDNNAGIDSGSGTSANTFGLGMRSSDMASGAILTYTVTGTDVDVWTCAGGSFAVSIDGAAYGTTISAAAQDVSGDITQVHLGASGSHTVAIKCVSGTTHFLGLTVYDGGRDKGAVMFDACHFGGSVADLYATGNTALNAKFTRTLALVNPHLVVMNLGLNDSNYYTPSQMIAQHQAMYDAIVATAPSASVMVVFAYDEVPDSEVGPTGYTYGDGKAAVATFASNNDLPLYLLSSGMPYVPTDTNGYYQPDGMHLTDKGDVLAASVVGPWIDPGYASLPAVTYGPAPTVGVSATGNGTTTGVTTQVSGSTFLVAVAQYGGMFTAPTDNKANTYTLLDTITASDFNARLYVCANGAGGSGHTWSEAGAPPWGPSVLAVEVIGGVVDQHRTDLFGNGGAFPQNAPYSSTAMTPTAVPGLLAALIAFDSDGSPTLSATSPALLQTGMAAGAGGPGSAIATLDVTTTAGASIEFANAAGAFTAANLFSVLFRPVEAITIGLSGKLITTSKGAVSVAASDVTVALTGQSASVARGAFGATRARALTGRRATDGRGAVAPAVVRAATGQRETVTGGSITAVSDGISVALTGRGAAVESGDVQSGIAVMLGGRLAAVSAGAVTATTDVRVALAGASLSVQIGTVAPQHTAAVTGQDASYATGTLTAVAGHNVTVALAGTACTVAQGSVLSGASAALDGARIAAAYGALTISREVAVAGVAEAFVLGTLKPRSGILITEPNRTAAFAAEQRHAVIAADQRDITIPADKRAARFVA